MCCVVVLKIRKRDLIAADSGALMPGSKFERSDKIEKTH